VSNDDPRPDDSPDDKIRRLGAEIMDQRAAEREHSFVSGETFRRLRRILDEEMEAAATRGESGARGEVVAERVVAEIGKEGFAKS
jgi:hypothetical protein